MPVKALYMEQAQLLKHTARVTEVGSGEINKKNYQWIKLDQTIFHPKGGGQLSDEGMIDGIKVVYVHKASLDKSRLDVFEILHCFEEGQTLSFKEGDLVELEINPQARELHSRMHTAGHVLAESVKEAFPELEPYHGNHDPKDGYVKFKMVPGFTQEKETILQKGQTVLNAWLQKDLPVDVIQLPSGMRGIQWANHVMTCGGTHVDQLNAIGHVEITDVAINKKENIVTVKYRLVD